MGLHVSSWRESSAQRMKLVGIRLLARAGDNWLLTEKESHAEEEKPVAFSVQAA